MSEEKKEEKMDRRKYIKYVGAGAVVAAAAAAIGYGVSELTKPPPPKPTTIVTTVPVPTTLVTTAPPTTVLKTVEKTVTTTVSTATPAPLANFFVYGQIDVEPILKLIAQYNELKIPTLYTLKAFVVGPGPLGIKKATNLTLGAETLNSILAMLGLPARVKIDVEFTELKWDQALSKFYTDFKAGAAPDIITFTNTADLAKGGFIVSMDEHVKKFWDVNYYDFHTILWEAATWGGKIWGIPHDLCPTGIWYRKDCLRKLGYSEDKIASMLPADGSTTLATVAKLAKEVVDAKLVDFGILHRPSWGPGIYGLMLAFDAEMYDLSTDKPILNKSALLKFFDWHREMVKDGVIPPSPPAWDIIHSTFVQGKTFATFASHIGTPSEWIAKYGLTEEALKKDLGFMPFPPAIPGLKPVSVAEIPCYFVTTQSKAPNIAKLVIMCGTSSEADAIHSEYTLRPPSRKSTLNNPRIKAIDYIMRTSPVASTVKPLPVYPKFAEYGGRIFNALKGVEANVVTPEKAVTDLEVWFKEQIPEGIIKE